MKDKIIEFIKTNPTVALTLITAYSWYCAYSFEKGTCVYFKVPFEYIDISTSDILKFASGLIGSAFLLVYYLHDAIKDGILLKASDLVSKVARAVFFAVIIGWYGIYMIAKMPATFYYAYCGVACVIILIIVIEHLVAKRRPNREAVVAKPGLILYIILVVFLIPLFCQFTGYGNASRKSTFSLLNGHESLVVVKKYGDNVFFKNFDKKKHTFGDSLVIVKLGPTNPINVIERTLFDD